MILTSFPYRYYDATGLAELVRKREVTANEIIETAINNMEQLNPRLNAVIGKMYDKARQAASKITCQEPFAGVPLLLKDIGQEIKGELITSGAKALQHYRAKEDATFVKRVRSTGVIFLGRTNIPEFALMGTTEPLYYGPARNPWNIDYTPGGSSGGSAAAVASGAVPIAGANDGGGSIRIPAAYCGLFGLKPSRGRTPAGPFWGRHCQGAAIDHVITRSVRDSAHMLDLIKGYEAGAAFAPPPCDNDYLECATQGPSRSFRIAFSIDSPIGTTVHSECQKAVIRAARKLESLGHYVEEKNAPVDGHKIAYCYIILYFGETATAIASLGDVLNRKARMSDVEPATWILSQLGKTISCEEWIKCINEWDFAAFKMEAFFEKYDLYMTPTTAALPSRIGEQDLSKWDLALVKTITQLNLVRPLKRVGLVDEVTKRILDRIPFTQLANLTGQPAMSVPLHLSPEGLPVGVQFITSKGREDILYRLAGQLEQTEIWIRAEENPMYSYPD